MHTIPLIIYPDDTDYLHNTTNTVHNFYSVWTEYRDKVGNVIANNTGII